MPNIIQATTQDAGIWTIQLDYPLHAFNAFTNILNSAPWTRAQDQPNNRRVVLAYDISVSKDNPINEGGVPIKGRLFSNEFVSIIQGNGRPTSPIFYVLSRDGFQYQIQFNDTDPFWFSFCCQ